MLWFNLDRIPSYFGYLAIIVPDSWTTRVGHFAIKRKESLKLTAHYLFTDSPEKLSTPEGSVWFGPLSFD